jgi:hypothetical protein
MPRYETSQGVLEWTPMEAVVTLLDEASVAGVPDEDSPARPLAELSGYQASEVRSGAVVHAVPGWGRGATVRAPIVLLA